MAALAGHDWKCGESTILTVKLGSLNRTSGTSATTKTKFLGFTMTLMCSSVPYLDLVDAVLTDTNNTLHYQVLIIYVYDLMIANSFHHRLPQLLFL